MSLALAPFKMSLETVAKVSAFSYRRSQLKATNLLVQVLYPLLSSPAGRVIGGSPMRRVGLAVESSVASAIAEKYLSTQDSSWRNECN